MLQEGKGEISEIPENSEISPRFPLSCLLVNLFLAVYSALDQQHRQSLLESVTAAHQLDERWIDETVRLECIGASALAQITYSKHASVCNAPEGESESE